MECHLEAMARYSVALAFVAFAILVGHHGGAVGANSVQPFLLCERDAALELAAAYQKGAREAQDTMFELAVVERCLRHPPGWSFEVAEIVAGPLISYDGMRFYVVLIDADDGRALYGLTWPLRGSPLPKRPAT